MSQLHVTLSPRTSGLFTDDGVDELGLDLVPVVEKAFGIEGKKDVAFTAVRASVTRGEADVQVEIRYTAARMNTAGSAFDPT